VNLSRGNPAGVADFMWEGSSKSGGSFLTEGSTSVIGMFRQLTNGRHHCSNRSV